MSTSNRRRSTTARPTKDTRRSTAGSRRRARSTPPESSLAPTDRQWLTADEAAAYLSIPPESVRELARRKILPGHKLKGTGASKLWRFAVAEIDEYVRGASA